MTVHLISGEDAALVSTTLSDLVHRLVGNEERSLMVDDFDGDDYLLADAVDAAQTPPFLTERRVVVAREIGRFNAEDISALTRYLADPLESTDLVLVAGGGRLGKALTDAVKGAGGQMVGTAAPSNKKERGIWMEQHVAEAGMHLDAAALTLVRDWLGEDAGRLASLLETLASTYGKTRILKTADVKPFLGEAGSVPPWDLTDAVDRGDTTTALMLLHRMMHAGERHPLQIMAILHNHYVRLLKLDGAEVHDENAAAALLGVKPGFTVRKAMELYRRLGSSAVQRAIALLASADLDLRGHRDWSESLVMEVLVARLSRLGGGADTRRR
ncbi:MAG: DNA polymerase III subunit delta [Actinobacteria bacterium]|uniref:DNA polymerase III subunit delta n=1 Tax=freshwater metagenome TaxID=449393 RepID=A0A6J6PUG3_9ZZZZ|nr:DNA polymerase III subunit delta [Actinomycetota bacterium]